MGDTRSLYSTRDWRKDHMMLLVRADIKEKRRITIIYNKPFPPPQKKSIPGPYTDTSLG